MYRKKTQVEILFLEISSRTCTSFGVIFIDEETCILQILGTPYIIKTTNSLLWKHCERIRIRV